MQLKSETLIDIKGLCNKFGDNLVHDNLDLSVSSREIVAIIGGSGCGKTTLLRSVLMLQAPTSGSIKLFGYDIDQVTSSQLKSIQHNLGVMFQSCALFSSLTIIENIMFPMDHLGAVDLESKRKLALLKLFLSGLAPEVADLYPSELSGGMKKRAAMARAIALDPKMIFLDEPTAGLDPVSANELDLLVLHLRRSLGITFVMVTHDLDTLWKVPDRVIFLGNGVVLADGSMEELMACSNPMVQDYFSGDRAQQRQKIGHGE